jgi:hypothetical protein
MHSTYSLKSAIYREPGEEFDYATVDAGNVDTEQKPSRVTLIATALDKLALMELDQQSEHENLFTVW